MKKYVAFFLAVLLIIFNSRPAPTFSEDYLIRYGRFLNYSFGEFAVVVDGEIESLWEISPKTWTVWELQYIHQNGEERNFRFSRNNNLNGTNYSYFGRQVLRHAMLNVGYKIEKEIARQYFMDEELVDIVVLQDNSFNTQVVRQNSVVQIMGRFPISRRRADVLNHRNGLRLYSITSQELVSEWDVEFGISLIIRDYENYEEMIGQLKEMTRAMSAYLEQDQVQIFVRFRDSNFDDAPSFNDFRGIYNRKTETFEIYEVGN